MRTIRCPDNPRRGQMGHGWRRALKSGAIGAYSAGIKADRTNPGTLRVLVGAGAGCNDRFPLAMAAKTGGEAPVRGRRMRKEVRRLPEPLPEVLS